MIPAISTTLIAVWALVHLVVGEGCHPNRPIENGHFRIWCESSDSPGLVTLTCKSPASQWSNFPKARLNLTGFNVAVEECGFPDDEQFHLLEFIDSLGLEQIGILTLTHLKRPLTPGLLRGISVNTLHFSDNKLITEFPEKLLHDVEIKASFWAVHGGLTELPPGFFLNQGNITHVDLNFNKIKKLDRAVFEPLVRLKQLYLNPNQLTEIEDGLFDQQTELQILEIGGNSLKTLPPNIFRNLKSLRFLHMARNYFTELPEQLLNQNENLVDFLMIKNQRIMKTVPNGFFKNLRKLEKVWLCDNQFTSLPADLFIGTESLKDVRLYGNNLTTLPSKIFADALKLQHVILYDNQLRELPNDIFNENANLEELDLSNNQLTNISESVLDGLDRLRILDVSHNSLMDINLKICEDKVNKNLKQVDISYNNLTSYEAFTNCVGIEEIVASNNNISKIARDDLVNKENLKTLNLANNRITKLPLSAISKSRAMNSLTSLDVSNNQISSIDMKNYIEPEHEVTVDVSNNPLTCDCQIYDFIHYLEMKNTIKYFNINMEILTCTSPPQLAGRSVENVRSSELTCSLVSNTTGDACNELCICEKNPGNKRLIIDCSHRNLKSVPAMISNVQNWSIALNMSGNNLQITPAMNQSYLSEVISLDLSSNNISAVTLNVFWGSLRELQLHNNSIAKLEPEVIDYLTDDTRLEKLTLHENNWNCDCEARNFLKFVQKKLSKLNLDMVKCHGTNRLLSTMTANELCENTIAIIVGACLAIALISIAVGVLAALYYKYQNEIKIWLYSKNLCLWFVTENELDKDKKYDAFISFSHKDEDFVVNEIINKLEEGPNPFKLCVHYRDWLAGEWIPEQIARSVEESRRTIVVLSPNFLESVWAGMEFRTAHNQALQEGRARVILILYGDIGSTDDLDPELKAYLSMNTYVKWGDPWFWDKLRYALPHHSQPSRSRTRKARIIENHLVQMSVQANNSHGKVEIITMPNINAATHDSVKLLDPRTEEDRIVNC